MGHEPTSVMLGLHKVNKLNQSKITLPLMAMIGTGKRLLFKKNCAWIETSLYKILTKWGGLDHKTSLIFFLILRFCRNLHINFFSGMSTETYFFF